MARQRSPNYPAMSLPAAIERVKAIHNAEGKNAMAREAMVKHMGFSSLNGASATALSAMGKYGLIESAGDGEVRISDLAMRLLFPHDGDEKAKAIQEAAFRPALFSKLRDKWPERPPSTESLRPYLIREGFSTGAVEQVIQFYRDTLDMVPPTGGAHDSSPMPDPDKEATVTNPESIPSQSEPGTPPPLPPAAKPFTVAFDGSRLTGSINIESVKDIDRLMRVLKAQKAAFEAMAEDDAAEDAPELDNEEEPDH